MVEAIVAQAFANFSERRLGEVRKKRLPRTKVHKGYSGSGSRCRLEAFR